MKRGLMCCVVAGMVSACAPVPQSYLSDRQVLERTQIARYPVVVVAIDGEQPTTRPVAIAPGVHRVTFDVAPIHGFHQVVEKTYSMTILPCTDYYVAADRANHLTQDWTLVIEAQDRVGYCDPQKELQLFGAPGVAARPEDQAQMTTLVAH